MARKKFHKSVAHTHTAPKKRVVVTLYAGDQFTDHYVGQEGRFHVFKGKGKVKSSLIYQVTPLTKSREVERTILEFNRDIK